MEQNPQRCRRRFAALLMIAFLQISVSMALIPSIDASPHGRAPNLEVVGHLGASEEYGSGKYHGMFPIIVQNSGTENATGIMTIPAIPQGWEWSIVEGNDILASVPPGGKVRVTIGLDAQDPEAGIYMFTVLIEPGSASTSIMATIPFEAGVLVSSPEEVSTEPDRTILVQVDIENKANGPDRFSLSLMIPESTWSHEIASGPMSPSLERGGTYTFDVEIKVPRNTPSSIMGKYGYQVIFKVTSVTDPDHVSTNITSVDIEQYRGVQLEITRTHQKVKCCPELVEIEAILENLGNGPQDVELSLTTPSGWTVQFEKRLLDLSAFERTTVQMYVAPSGNVAGDHTIELQARGTGIGTVMATTQIPVADRYGPVGHQDTTPSADPGQTVISTISVMNIGNTLDLVEIVPEDVPDGWSLTLRPSVVSLLQGDSMTVTASIMVSPDPLMALEGRHSIDLGLISLYSDARSKLRLHVDIRPVPSMDMTPQDAFKEVNPFADPIPVYIFRVRNTGNTRITTNIAPSSLTGHHEWATPSREALTLDPGEVSSFHAMVNPPLSTTPGVYTLGFEASTNDGGGYSVSTSVSLRVIEMDIILTELEVRRSGSTHWKENITVGADDQVEVVAWITDVGSDNAPSADVVLMVDGKVISKKEDQGLDDGPTGVSFRTTLEEGWHNITVYVIAPGEVDTLDNDMSLRVFAEPAPEMITPGAAAAGITLTSIILMMGAILGHEGLKFKALLYLVVPLYTRIKKESTLDNFTRGRIFGYIEANPGEHYNSIKKALSIPNGSLAYHLQTLEREGFIKFHLDGIYKRFYPKHMILPKDEEGRIVPEALTKMQTIIHEKVGDCPGISQRQMSRALNLAPSTVNYHVRMMAMAGILRLERRVGRTQCFLENDVSCAEDPA